MGTAENDAIVHAGGLPHAVEYIGREEERRAHGADRRRIRRGYFIDSRHGCYLYLGFVSTEIAGVGRNTQVRRNYTTPHKTQMIDTTINLLVNRTEYTNLPGTTLTLRLAVKSDNSSPAILFPETQKNLTQQ